MLRRAPSAVITRFRTKRLRPQMNCSGTDVSRRQDVYSESKELDANLDVKLYNGTPTIFMLSTSWSMFFNPYTFYSRAFDSRCFGEMDG